MSLVTCADQCLLNKYEQVRKPYMENEGRRTMEGSRSSLLFISKRLQPHLRSKSYLSIEKPKKRLQTGGRWTRCSKAQNDPPSNQATTANIGTDMYRPETTPANHELGTRELKHVTLMRLFILQH